MAHSHWGHCLSVPYSGLPANNQRPRFITCICSSSAGNKRRTLTCTMNPRDAYSRDKRNSPDTLTRQEKL